MKAYTVCLYDGTVNDIDEVIAVELVATGGIDQFDHLALFYDVAETITNGNYSYNIYKNRITGKTFPVMYERCILFSKSIHSYDFGSHTRFIAVVAGDHRKDIKKYFNAKVLGIN